MVYVGTVGNYAEVTVTKQLSDVRLVLNYVSMLPDVDAINSSLIVHSLGGSVA
ncbi:hypothetical protein [Sporosarcina sp. E16_8]|uniref:hypothetical protein n=1 Tax=Sporosarcina sp. E16_8 TaxID=2789295 RepID=UPI001A913753|nr:hypothetical protein [Sporosarcina sp. E16_8]MBO0589617.1 hypothetical protein [Sporosarcina sp. E16_8]